MKLPICFLFLTLFSSGVFAQYSAEQGGPVSASTAYASPEVKVVQSEDGHRLIVDGEAFMINGMNWDYFPVGTNFAYSLWNQSDEFIKAALDQEMSMLRNMGVNAVKQYVGVTYIPC